jgi:hypothetical protein
MSKKPTITTGTDPLGNPTKSVVYSADNIAKSATAEPPNYAKMSVDSLGKTIAKAKNKAELNQVNIMNQPLSMGVITGQAAHMANINNAQINSLSGMYDAKNAELTRKQNAEQQKFTNDLALKTYGLNEKNTLSEIAARNNTAKLGTVTQQQGKVMTAAENALYQSKGTDGFVDPGVYQSQRQEYVNAGGKYTDFDNQFGKMLSDQEQSNLKLAGGLSNEAIDIAAQTYLTTGQMPALGMGNAQMRSEILNRAGSLSAEQGLSLQDVITGRAQYRASSGSLNNLQKYADQVLSFETTAGSNLDLANSLSDKVDRSGSPLINKYDLYLKGQLQGDPNTLAFMAAVQTATNEYAKVVTGQTGGAAVSDAARKETESMLNAAYSPEAFKKVIETMKQEMENRRQGLTGQLQTITGSLFFGGSAQAESSMSDEQAYQIYQNLLNKQ